MTRMIELTDLTTSDPKPVVVPVDDVSRTICGWYPTDDHDHPAELAEIVEFQAALLAEDFEEARDLAAELGVSFYEVAETQQGA